MSASGEMFLRMREDDYNALTPEQRAIFTYVEKFEINEWETHKEDAMYVALWKEKKKTSEKLKNYLFDKRNK